MRELHLPHFRRPDWHELGMETDRIFHSPWFWIVVLFSFFVLLVIISAFFVEQQTGGQPVYHPMHYPFVP